MHSSIDQSAKEETGTFFSQPAIIPLPQNMIGQPGEVILHAKTELDYNLEDPGLIRVARFFQQWINAEKLKPANDENSSKARLIIDSGMPPEAYSFTATPEEIAISGGNAAGVFYGIQTLIQLAKPWRKNNNIFLSIPSISINDAPAFSYRGMHLDVARHLFPVSFIKQYIDILARYKMNHFHWHLTEDQGWRIEIKKYPKLQEVAAFRKETMVGHLNDRPQQMDGQPYGGYYTQEEIREIVKYAEDRFVTIIPEIELPGHAQAAIAAYPELGCLQEPLEVATQWGIIENVFCPSEQTFTFLENVLTEVMELFPSPYIHIGGDECPKTQWETNSLCQQIIRDEKLKDENQLQSYFVQRIERFLHKHDRKLIGWDEILEGGLAPRATVMSWRGEKGGIEAARLGHDVIMTPSDYCYFDFYQAAAPNEPLAIGGLTPLEKVYHYHPIPESLTTKEAQHILGAQANVWTEYMKKPENVEYMIYPRMQALSEVIWSGKEKKDFPDFIRRLRLHLCWLKQEGINAADHLGDL